MQLKCELLLPEQTEKGKELKSRKTIKKKNIYLLCKTYFHLPNSHSYILICINTRITLISQIHQPIFFINILDMLAQPSYINNMCI